MEEEEEEQEEQEEDQPKEEKVAMEEVGSSVYTRGREVLDAEHDAEETGVGKSTVASVDGECWRARTNETKSSGSPRVSARRGTTSEGNSERLRHAEEEEGTGGRANVRTHVANVGERAK